MRQTHEQNPEPYAYIEELCHASNDGSLAFLDLLRKSKEESYSLGKAGISISTAEGQLLEHFVRTAGCKKFVEIGTLTGYSSLWILKGMGRESHLFTLEKDPKHAGIARDILAKACAGIFLQAKAEVIEGDAREELKKLSAKGPFDGVFIDGNKSAYLDYLNWAEKNVKAGGLILADNVFLSGAVWGADVSHFSKKQVEVMQEFNRRLTDSKIFQTVFVPTTEGLAVAVRR
jgi:predicted O-methyltransferase YrrM